MMSSGKLVSLRQIRAGQRGKVVEIHGGYGMINRLGALGIRPGCTITKVSSMLMRGPVTIRVGHTQLAIGYGMASKILIEPI